MGAVHETLDKPWLTNRYRFRFYEYVVEFFLHRGEIMKASVLYARLTREGYIPTVSLRTQMRIITLAEQAPPDEVVLDAIRQAMANRSFTERALLMLLRLLGDSLRAAPQFIENVVLHFLVNQPPGYRLSARTRKYVVQAYLRLGDRDRASRWSSADFVPPLPGAGPDFRSPYTTLLRDLAASDPSFSQYVSALAKMRKEMPALVPNLPFFNALLSHEVNRRNFTAVFAIYERMMALRSKTVTPDTDTYAIIFRAISRLSTSSRRRRGLHVLRPPPNMPDPRVVYRDMLTCHIEHQAAANSHISPALALPSIHAALHTFMSTRDYPAAFNVVRAFRAYPTHIDRPVLATYHAVVGDLLKRIKAELPTLPLQTEHQRVWTYRFLGLGAVPRHWRASIPCDLSMLRRVLHMGTEPRLNLEFVHVSDFDDDAVAQHPERGVRAEVNKFIEHGIPTPLQFAEAEPVPELKPFEVAPLERLLRRAMLASIEDEVDPPYVRHVSAAIADAKADMVP